MKVCEHCLKAIESREGKQNIKDIIYFNDIETDENTTFRDRKN